MLLDAKSIVFKCTNNNRHPFCFEAEHYWVIGNMFSLVSIPLSIAKLDNLVTSMPIEQGKNKTYKNFEEWIFFNYFRINHPDLLPKFKYLRNIIIDCIYGLRKRVFLLCSRLVIR